MAGEALLINPRRRRGRRKRARARVRRRRRRARRNPFEYAMNRRRRRRVGRRRRRARARHNQRIRTPLGTVDLGAIGGGTLGYFATRYATGGLLSVLPKEWMVDPNTAPLWRIGTKAVVGLALPMVLRPILPRGIRGFANWFAVGGGIAAAVDLFETYIAKMIPIPMADYEQQVLTDYETRQLTGLGQEEGETIGQASAFGGSAYAGGAF